MKALVAVEDPLYAENGPYELLVPGDEFPSSILPVGGEPRPKAKLLWRPQRESKEKKASSPRRLATQEREIT
jgi:hypothetical protein